MTRFGQAGAPLLAGALLLTLGVGRSVAPARPGPGAPVVLGSLSLVAVGDVLMHRDVMQAGLHAPGGLPDLWRDVAPLFLAADIAFANLEAPVAPRSGRPGRPFVFNAPEGLPAALKASGLTVLATANNHAFDQGPQGVLETLERLRAMDLQGVGTGATREEAERPCVVERHGVKVAFLAFTDIFNLDLNGEDARPRVRRLDPASAASAVREARALAHAVVVSVHWGNEYSHRPSRRQRSLARILVEAGADVILGHHPHVLQPTEILEAGGRKALVAYSLGNFISNQDRLYRFGLSSAAEGDNRDGEALMCRLVRLRTPDGGERMVVEGARCEALWTENNCEDFQAGRTKVRSIRVLRVDRALARLGRELGRIQETPAGLPGGDGDRVDRIASLQLATRALRLRRERAGEMLGPGCLAGPGPCASTKESEK